MAVQIGVGVTTPSRYRSEFLQFLQPVLDALRERGGEARPREVYDLIAVRFNISEEERSILLSSGVSRFENQIAWARGYLALTGYIDPEQYGIWRLTPKGWDANLDGPDIDAIYQRVQEIRALKRRASIESSGLDAGSTTTPPFLPSDSREEKTEDDLPAPSATASPYSDHRAMLITLISGMSAEGFERFCAELLERVGVEDVQVTQLSRDHGIDGHGNLRVNEFVTVPVAFQAKKLDGSGRKVTSEEIQRFRGAMGRRIEKGIFFTTTTFTDDAKRESQRSDHVVVELVDLDRILEICEKYRIGLKEQTVLIPNTSWFSRFS